MVLIPCCQSSAHWLAGHRYALLVIGLQILGGYRYALEVIDTLYWLSALEVIGSDVIGSNVICLQILGTGFLSASSRLIGL